MCGIAGIFAYKDSAPPVDRAELVRIRDSMALRGPDGQGEWFSADGRVGLGHRRLAIIDLSPSGAQPMTSDDGRLVIVFNGEIYNYRELRAGLEREGVRFRTSSDTEVILEMYKKRGERAIGDLRGMFAILLWDSLRSGLLLARDPFGIKPLYYADDGRSLRAASQVKALLAGGRISTDPEPAGIAGFFLWGSVPEPHTLHREIRSLPAGSTLWIDGARSKEPRRFFNLAEIFREGPANGDDAETTEDSVSRMGGEPGPAARESDAVRSAFLDSVQHHLVADVEVGAFLSAGIDSSALVSLVSEIAPEPPRTVTLGFEEFRGTPADETPLALQTARRLGTRHETRHIDRAHFLAELPRILAAMDQPSIDGVNTYLVSQATAQAGLKVALSGLGGDELLGGYPTFRDLPWMVRGAALKSRIPALGRIARPVLSPLLGARVPKRYASLLDTEGTYPEAYLIRRGLFAPRELAAVVGEEIATEGLRRLDPTRAARESLEPDPGAPFARVSVLEANLYMRNQLLRDSDWASMAHSLELRVPLVDAVLWRTLARLLGPTSKSRSKSLLASAPRPPLPKELVHRKKTGFGIPVWDWVSSSPQFDSWRRLPMLHEPGLQGPRRWAYTVFERFAGSLMVSAF